jgi:DNA-binding CsgD family transcriptional regulator
MHRLHERLMHNDDLPDRVSLLSAQLLNVLALMAEGLSNGQIASRLGYNNAHVVATYVYMINKELGLTNIDSALEKRHLAIEAFKKTRAEPLKIQISIGSEAGIKSNMITISKVSADQIRSLVARDYEIASVELIRRVGRTRRKR